MTAVDIPVDWLAQEPRLPGQCVLHGLPAARTVTFAVRSKPKIGSRKKVLLPGYTSLNRADEYVRQVQVATVSGWPLCARCVRRRRLGLTHAEVLFFGGVLAMVIGFVVAAATAGPNTAMVAPILAGFAAILASPLPLRWASLPQLTRAELTPDGSAVHVTAPSAEFASNLPQRS
jgi:hypothetical protein